MHHDILQELAFNAYFDWYKSLSLSHSEQALYVWGREKYRRHETKL